MTGFAPDFAGARVRPSPNFGERRGTPTPDMIVLHYTGMESGPAAEAWLCNPASEVSSHYIVHEDGRVVQMVREIDRAWHAGKSSWHGHGDINSASIGIEVVNPGHAFGYPDFPVQQIDSVISLCRDIMRRQGISADRVLAHSDVAPGRKIDPGEKFPWRRLAGAGLGVFAKAKEPDEAVLLPGDSGKRVERLQSMLARFGYGIEATGTYDAPTEIVVAAFQRHHRPARLDGLADRSTLDVLRRLIRRGRRGAA
jgi:N-acetylmuramoyl-L-alanine amidase